MGNRDYGSMELAWGQVAYGFLFMLPTFFYYVSESFFLLLGVFALNVLAVYFCRPVRFLFVNDLNFRVAISVFYVASVVVAFLLVFNVFYAAAVFLAMVLAVLTYVFVWLYNLEEKLGRFGWKNIGDD